MITILLSLLRIKIDFNLKTFDVIPLKNFNLPSRNEFWCCLSKRNCIWSMDSYSSLSSRIKIFRQRILLFEQPKYFVVKKIYGYIQKNIYPFEFSLYITASLSLFFQHEYIPAFDLYIISFILILLNYAFA